MGERLRNVGEGIIFIAIDFLIYGLESLFINLFSVELDNIRQDYLVKSANHSENKNFLFLNIHSTLVF